MGASCNGSWCSPSSGTSRMAVDFGKVRRLQPGRAVRSGRDLIEATKSFAPESLARSWWLLLSTTAILLGSYALLWQPIFWPLRLLLAVFAGLVTVREFILFHDYMHGALLRGSRLARV